VAGSLRVSVMVATPPCRTVPPLALMVAVGAVVSSA
jgi:hypothetical protein